jgi:hypothetical protein
MLVGSGLLHACAGRDGGAPREEPRQEQGQRPREESPGIRTADWCRAAPAYLCSTECNCYYGDGPVDPGPTALRHLYVSYAPTLLLAQSDAELQCSSNLPGWKHCALAFDPNTFCVFP